MIITCPRCKGKGYCHEKIQNLGTRDWEWHIVDCLQPGCERGKIDRNKKCDCDCECKNN